MRKPLAAPLAALLGLAVSLATVSAFAAIDGYLKMDNVTGESQDPQHKDWIGLSSFSVGIASQSNGAGAGKVRFQDINITVTRRVDRTSLALRDLAVSRKPIAHATIEFTNENEHTVVWRAVMTNAVVTSYKTLTDTGASVALDQLTLAADKLEISSRTAQNNGTFGEWVPRDSNEVKKQLPNVFVRAAPPGHS